MFEPGAETKSKKGYCCPSVTVCPNRIPSLSSSGLTEEKLSTVFPQRAQFNSYVLFKDHLASALYPGQ